MERGGKIAASKSREVKSLQKKVDMNSPSEISYVLDEKLELVATLYKGFLHKLVQFFFIICFYYRCFNGAFP